MDSTPDYAPTPIAACRIKASFPQARLIFLLKVRGRASCAAALVTLAWLLSTAAVVTLTSFSQPDVLSSTPTHMLSSTRSGSFHMCCQVNALEASR